MRALLVAASLLLTALAAAPVASATSVADCIGQPGAVAVCASSDGGTRCASVGIGLQGVRVCAGPGGAEVCLGIICREVGLDFISLG